MHQTNPQRFINLPVANPKSFSQLICLWVIFLFLLTSYTGCAQPGTQLVNDQDRPQSQTGLSPASGSAGGPLASSPKRSDSDPEHSGCKTLRAKPDLDICTQAAAAGDQKAAQMLGEAYSVGLRNEAGGLSIKRDPDKALKWHTRAYELGNMESLRYLFQAYYYGIKVKADPYRSAQLLDQAAGLGQHWAIMVNAAQAEKQERRKTAWQNYLRLAIEGNCHAQEKMALLNMQDYFRPANYTLAYFWGILADKAAFKQHSEFHNMAGRSSTGSTLCGQSKAKHKAKSFLSPKYYRLAERAALNWKTGDAEPDLPSPLINPRAHSLAQQRAAKAQKAKIRLRKDQTNRIYHWQALWEPIELPQAMTYSKELKPVELFKAVNKSVWKVLAASTQQSLAKQRYLSMGSGVAVAVNLLITNYHVVIGRPYIQIQREGKKYEAHILYADKKTDRCVLLVKGELEPLKGFRTYRSLRVGELVYSVGSPKGLENTLGHGLISGLRKDGKSGLRLIQTNAQISKGSSGGGLFDRFGNLIGITTLKIRRADSLNFAISVEDFTR